MESLYLNENGDLEINDNKDLTMISDLEEFKQRIGIEIKNNKGEWFLNTEFGVPWINMFRDKATDDIILEEVRKVVKGFEDVEEIIDIQLIRNRGLRTAKLEVKLRVNTTTLNIEVVL